MEHLKHLKEQHLYIQDTQKHLHSKLNLSDTSLIRTFLLVPKVSRISLVPRLFPWQGESLGTRLVQLGVPLSGLAFLVLVEPRVSEEDTLQVYTLVSTIWELEMCVRASCMH